MAGDRKVVGCIAERHLGAFTPEEPSYEALSGEFPHTSRWGPSSQRSPSLETTSASVDPVGIHLQDHHLLREIVRFFGLLSVSKVVSEFDCNAEPPDSGSLERCNIVRIPRIF